MQPAPFGLKSTASCTASSLTSPPLPKQSASTEKGLLGGMQDGHLTDAQLPSTGEAGKGVDWDTVWQRYGKWCQWSSSTVHYEGLCISVKVDRTVAPVDWATPGPAAGLKCLKSFLTKARLSKYASQRNDPNAEALSGVSIIMVLAWPSSIIRLIPCVYSLPPQLSPYFHFGHLAPQRAAYEANKVRSSHKESVDAFIEESVVRRELSDNYCFYNPR